MLIQILWQIKLEECVITSHTYLYCSYSWGFLITPKSLRLSKQYIKAKSVSLHEFAIQCTYVSSQININSSLVRTWAYTLSHWRPEYISYLIFGADVSKSGFLHTYPVLQQTHICHVNLMKYSMDTTVSLKEWASLWWSITFSVTSACRWWLRHFLHCKRDHFISSPFRTKQSKWNW